MHEAIEDVRDGNSAYSDESCVSLNTYFGGFSRIARQRRGLWATFLSALLGPTMALPAIFRRNRPGDVEDLANKHR